MFKILGHAEAVLCVSFSPDGKQLASGSGDTTVRLWDLNTETPLFTCKGSKISLTRSVIIVHPNNKASNLLRTQELGTLNCLVSRWQASGEW